MAKFEVVSRFKTRGNDENSLLPQRSTIDSAGYDFKVAEEVIIAPYFRLLERMNTHLNNLTDTDNDINSLNSELALMLGETWEEGSDPPEGYFSKGFLNQPFTLEQATLMTKQANARPTLVSTGVKCELSSEQYLQLSVRSSSPLKNWLILANGVGIIDADYFNNPSNEGEIFFQLINLSPYVIKVKEGDIIGQGIIKYYETVEDENTITETRTGGFGSTTR